MDPKQQRQISKYGKRTKITFFLSFFLTKLFSSEDVLGPVILDVSVPNPKHAICFEKAIPRYLLMGFVCQCEVAFPFFFFYFSVFDLLGEGGD